MRFPNSLLLAHAWLICFTLLAHAGVGVVRFANEGEIFFEGDCVVQAAGVLGSGGVVVLEEGLWKVGDQTITVSAGTEVDLGKIKIRGEHIVAPPVQQQSSRALNVEAAPDQQWRLAGENAWRQGSATVMACDGSHRLEWKEGERVTGRLLVVSEGAQEVAKLPVPMKVQPPSTTDMTGTWITGPARGSGPQSGDVAVLQNTSGRVVAWQQLGSAATGSPSDRVGGAIPLVALDKNAQMAMPEDLMPKNPAYGSSTAFKGWETVDINNRDYVSADSIRNFYDPLYGFTTFRLQGNQFWLGSSKLVLKAQVGSQEMLINNIKFILSFPVQTHNGKVLFSRLDLCKLIDPVLCPSHIQNAEYFDTVVIDAGHGGNDAGAVGVRGNEKYFTRKLSMSLRDALERRGFKVVMTRDTDTSISEADRVMIVNNTVKSILISLHFNSGATSTTGVETIALAPRSSLNDHEFDADAHAGNANDAANISLAAAVHASVISRFKFVDRGIKREHPELLINCKRPGIIFRGGFITNNEECLLIDSDTYRQQVSAAIADAVMNYRKALESAMARR